MSFFGEAYLEGAAPFNSSMFATGGKEQKSVVDPEHSQLNRRKVQKAMQALQKKQKKSQKTKK